MRQLGIAALIAVLLMIGSFGFGAFVTSNHYQKKIADFKADAALQYAQALEAKSTREKYLQDKANSAATQAAKEKNEIEARYKSLLADAADAFSLHADGARSKNGVPGDASAPGAVSERANQRAGADGAKFQKLYQEQLAIARDCDITAAHYNELINLWNEAVKENEN